MFRVIKFNVGKNLTKANLLVFALVFSVIGGYAIYKSFAAPNINLPGDLNNNNKVDIVDISILLSNYNTTNNTADINSDGSVNILDLSILLSNYGKMAGGPLVSWSEYGFQYSAFYNDAYDMQYDSNFDAMLPTGANSVAIMVQWYQPNPTSTAIARDSLRTPSDAGVRRAIQRAKAAGLHVFLRPYLQVSDGSYRGSITPSDVNAWFASYRNFINYYAAIAQQEGVDKFGVGVEMVSMTDNTANGTAINVPAWQQVINEARTHYSGKIAYSANWGDINANYAEFQKVGFWNDVDEIGVDAYFPIAASAGALTDTMTNKDTNFWPYGNVTNTGTRVRIAPSSGLTDKDTRDLRDGSVTLDIPVVPTGTGAQALLKVTSDAVGNNGWHFTLQNGNTWLLREISDGQLNDTTAPYNSSQHYIKIRFSGSTVYYEVSSDGTNWSVLRSKTTTFSVRRAFVSILNTGSTGNIEVETETITAPQYSTNPSIADLKAAWTELGIIDALKSLAAAYPTKRFALHEIAYASAEKTASIPYVEGTDPRIGVASESAQSNAIEAMYEALGNQPWLDGMYYWDWQANYGARPVTDKADSPRGLAAEQVVRHWYGKQ
jgi:hypothetical protein